MTAIRVAEINILLVDDEPDLADTCQEHLENVGYKVTSMCKPREALDCLLNNLTGFDLAITDYFMPEMDGGRLSLAIQDIRPDIPVILMTGYMHQIDLKNLGISAVLPKPFSLKTLDETIRKVLFNK